MSNPAAASSENFPSFRKISVRNFSVRPKNFHPLGALKRFRVQPAPLCKEGREVFPEPVEVLSGSHRRERQKGKECEREGEVGRGTTAPRKKFNKIVHR